MSHLALYRKYRSQTFGDLKGQEHVVRTLQNSLETGRMAHAYLFTGPRGTGKTSSARLLAKALNCEKGPAAEPCNECEACLSITIGSNMDVLELDAASESGVEDVREKIVGVTDYQPTSCRFKIFIIDEVHDLSTKAFDALLKTIEEPPAHIVFILATTEFSKVPPTIRSRCQRFEFHRATVHELIERLKFVIEGEGLTAEPAALSAIARMADGGYRDALTLLEQAILMSDGHLTLGLVYDQLGLIADEAIDALLLAIRSGEVKTVVEQLDALNRAGRDPKAILESMLHRLAELTRTSYGVEIGADSDQAVEASLHAVATQMGREMLIEYRTRIARAIREVRDVSLPRLWMESELIGLAVGPQVRAVTVTSAAPPAVAPRPAPAAPAPVERAAPPRVASAAPRLEEKAVEPIKMPPSGDAALDEARAQWVEVIGRMSAISRAAGGKLVRTFVEKIDDTTAQVAFELATSCDWVKASSKVQGAITKEWVDVSGGALKLEYVLHEGRQKPVVATDGAVELPLSGDSLREEAKRQFESF